MCGFRRVITQKEFVSWPLDLSSVIAMSAAIGMIFRARPILGRASCGPVSCFVVIGSQQQVPMKVYDFNAIYNYTPMEAPPGGRTHSFRQSGR